MPFTSSIHNNGMKNKIKERREKKNAMKWFDCFIRVPPHECCRSSAGRLHRDGVNERESESWRAKEPPKETRSIHKMFMEMVLSCSLANATLNNFWSGFLVSNSDTANRQRVDWLEREIFFFFHLWFSMRVLQSMGAHPSLTLCIYSVLEWDSFTQPMDWYGIAWEKWVSEWSECVPFELPYKLFDIYTNDPRENFPGGGRAEEKYCRQQWDC